MQGDVLPDALSGLNSDWMGEGKSMSMWPPCIYMYCHLAEYLVDTSERDLRTRLLTDYKEGKAFSSLSGGLRDLYVLWETGTEQKGRTNALPYTFLKSWVDCTILRLPPVQLLLSIPTIQHCTNWHVLIIKY